MNNNLKKTVFASLFAALVFAATYVIKIPTPSGGYVHLGDGFCLVSGFVLGPVYGALSAGIGSMLTDVLSGYTVYAPATLIIKALMTLVATLIFKSLHKKTSGLIIGSIVGELIMVFGYFLFSCLILGNGISAAVSILSDLGQGAVGVIFATIIMQVFKKTNLIKVIGGDE